MRRIPVEHLTKVIITSPATVDREAMVSFAAHAVTKISASIAERNLIRRFGITPLVARGLMQEAQLRVRREGGTLHRHQRLATSRLGFLTKGSEDDGD
jgi:hypothetical protein